MKKTKKTEILQQIQRVEKSIKYWKAEMAEIEHIKTISQIECFIFKLEDQLDWLYSDLSHEKTYFKKILTHKKEHHRGAEIFMSNCQTITIFPLKDFDYDDDEGLLHIYNGNVYIQCRIDDILYIK